MIKDNNILLEADSTDIHIYIDDETGDYYYFDGEKLVLMGHKPQIGDRGIKGFQDEEEKERKKEIEQDGPDEGDELEDEEAKLKRIQKIKNAFEDSEFADMVSDETAETIRREQRKKADKKAAQYKASPLQSFKLSLEGFIKNQISVQKGVSWSKINKTYAHSGIMKPGRTRQTQGKIPVINVYFDQSSSWGPEDIKVGEQAISTLNKYVRQGEIAIRVFYFANRVSGDRNEYIGGGTDLDPVITHINATKPDNVIIMTDGDGDWTDYTSSAQVPGAVWFLWRNRRSQKLAQHLKGKQLTRSFDLK